ncbi:PQQ-binding-like beta-propeller repeat protein [Streptomyces sp. NPDC127114]|uniref:protein kinase domain-containing protein n=1 Tax=Streptomyces sp. NPDC127114 TaxID=3345366 RepID=UPI003641BB55
MLGPLREGTPRRIGPYEVLARLGAGGMGEVYLARLDAPGRTPDGPGATDTAPTPDGPGATDTARTPGGPGAGARSAEYVAVKTVRRDVAGEPAFRERFRREIRVAGLVRSAHAAAPVGGDADAEVPWLATAYVPGPSLAQAVRRGGPLPVATVRALGARVARALADLHGAGVLHRDLKPGNVMLAVDGPRLIDFGIARASGATTMTATGLMVGTPSFMSPEHVAGARHVTGASDVFCLGSLLCYAATGEDPFGDGPVAAVLYRVSQAEADLTRVPEELRGVVASCLSRDPADRPTPEALVELLGGDGGPAPAWPEAVREHIGEYGRELAQLVAAGGPLVEVPAAPATPPGAPAAAAGPDPLHAAATQAPSAPAGPAPGRRRRGLVAAVAALAVLGGGIGAYLLWPEPDPGSKKPTAAPPAASGPRVPGVDDRGLADASGVVPQNAAQRPAGWKPWRAKLSAPAFGCSGNEKALVCRTTDGRYEAVDPANGEKLWEANLIEDPRNDDSYISPTGAVVVAGGSARPTVHHDLVALAGETTLQVRDARTGAVRWEQESGGGHGVVSRPVVGDGTLFLASTGEGGQTRLVAYGLGDGRELWSKGLSNADLARSDYKDFEPVAYAEGLVYALSDGGLVAYDAGTGDLRGQVDADARTCEEIKVLGANAYCADLPHSAGEPENLHLLDAATLASKASLPSSVATLRPAVLTPTAAIGHDGENGGLKVYDPRDGSETGAYAAKAAPAGLSHAWSAPLLVDDRIVYADYSSLHTVRLDAKGRPAGLRSTAVPGAPGPRADKGPAKPLDGVRYDEMLRAPEVLPVGGIAYLVYDQGVVVSVELPR